MNCWSPSFQNMKSRLMISFFALNFSVGYLSLNEALANKPQVVFDARTLVECRDVTPKGFVTDHPNQKVIEALFRISVRVKSGKEADITQLVVDISSPERRLQVYDFSPQKKLQSDYLDNIKVTKTHEDVRTINAAAGGTIAVPLGPIHAKASPSANLTKTKRDAMQETMHRLPNKNTVLISGTTNSEHGLFFKIKPNSQDTLEGIQEFRCQFVVPKDWSGDWARIVCRAEGWSKKYWQKKIVNCGTNQFDVGLYMIGDLKSRSLARRLTSVEVQRVKEISQKRCQYPVSGIYLNILDDTISLAEKAGLKKKKKASSHNSQSKGSADSNSSKKNTTPCQQTGC